MKLRWFLLAVAVLMAFGPHLSRLRAEPVKQDPASLGFIKGFSWGWVGSRGEYAAPAATESLEKLADTGTEWVCIAFGPNMKSYDTPEILYGDANPRMITDDELRHAIDVARARGSR